MTDGRPAIGLVTDSAASLPADLAEAWGVTVVPQRLVVDGVDHADGDTAVPVAGGRLARAVTTSAPSPGAFVRAIADAAGREGVLVATVAASMTATTAAARLAATEAGEAGERVRVVDTGTAAGAEALVVLATAAAVRAGRSLEEVEAVARRVASSVRLVAVIDGLDHLVRSGRVPGIAGWAGRRLGVRPLFELRAGKVRSLRPAASRAAAVDRMVRLARHGRPGGRARLHAAALHADVGGAAEAAALLAAVTAGTDPATAFVAPFSPVMVAHTGPGVLGLAWWWEAGRPSG